MSSLLSDDLSLGLVRIRLANITALGEEYMEIGSQGASSVSLGDLLALGMGNCSGSAAEHGNSGAAGGRRLASNYMDLLRP